MNIKKDFNSFSSTKEFIRKYVDVVSLFFPFEISGAEKNIISIISEYLYSSNLEILTAEAKKDIMKTNNISSASFSGYLKTLSKYNLYRDGKLHKAFIIPKEEKEININIAIIC
jgi:hypothetical protein